MSQSTSQRVSSITMSAHARKRGHQRAISRADIDLALRYGRTSRSYGDRCFTLTDRALRDTPHEASCDRLRGLCVILTGDNTVRTVKWDGDTTRRPGVLRRSRRVSR